ncbi:hypothetical protein N7488_004370 [Penicillium malachiteum]|nr:hypothetical protein N7488_004370 [Penicillium malachiteum]
MARVLRIPRSDEQDSFILIHVVSSGGGPLNLTLTATEGECPYAATVKASHLKGLRAKNYQGSDDEWTQIISHILKQSTPTTSSAAYVGVETSASITGSNDEDKELVITVRKRVQSITQKLGSITLKQDDDQAIELFEWSGISLARVEELENQTIELSDRCRVADETIQKLKEQLDDLIKAKVQHESNLIANFAQLLNEKKLKIRNQQRLLSAATVDPTKVAEIQAHSVQSHAAKEDEHLPKRGAENLGDTDDESDDGFEKMEVDQGRSGNSLEDRDTEDEDENGGTTTDDDSDGSMQDEVPPRKSQEQGNDKPRRSNTKEVTPPPRRELPFTRRKPAAQPEAIPVQSEVNEAEETAGETDDDEL